MKIFLDTEFLEGPQTKRIFGIPCGKTKPTIDLISIGLVAEDGAEYYAVSKDFNLREAWDRYDLDMGSGDQRNKPPRKTYWIRENVLRPIFDEFYPAKHANLHHYPSFTYKNMKGVINAIGKSNAEIAFRVKAFSRRAFVMGEIESPEFYAYYADYDWVAFCWLFGKMMDLPKGFPMYCNDLKQNIDERTEKSTTGHTYFRSIKGHPATILHSGSVKEQRGYPKQTNEHNALADAKWNFELYKFLQTI